MACLASPPGGTATAGVADLFRDTRQLAIHRASFSNRETSFNLQTRTQDGLRYVLVGDLNAASLQQPADLWQQHHPQTYHIVG